MCAGRGDTLTIVSTAPNRAADCERLEVRCRPTSAAVRRIHRHFFCVCLSVRVCVSAMNLDTGADQGQ